MIDEVVLKINPLMLGTGIPLVAHLEKALSFELIGSKVYDNGVVLLSYEC